MAYAKGELAAILKGLGAPATSANIRALQAWAQAEGGSATYNPFNSTQSAPGASSYNSVGVRNYRNEQQGIAATIQTLKNGRYAAILAALHAGNNPLAVARAVGASPWGTSGSLLAQILGGAVHGNATQAAQHLGGGGAPPAFHAPPPLQFHAPVINLPQTTQVSPAQYLASILANDQQSSQEAPLAPLVRQTPSYVDQLQSLHSGLLRATT